MTPAEQYGAVLEAVELASQQNEEFSTDEVWPLLDFVPTNRNIIGKAFSESARLNVIRGTERFIRSSRPLAKGRRVQVWTAA